MIGKDVFGRVAEDGKMHVLALALGQKHLQRRQPKSISHVSKTTLRGSTTRSTIESKRRSWRDSCDLLWF
jgi:hypothetical protein